MTRTIRTALFLLPLLFASVPSAVARVDTELLELLQGARAIYLVDIVREDGLQYHVVRDTLKAPAASATQYHVGDRLPFTRDDRPEISTAKAALVIVTGDNVVQDHSIAYIYDGRVAAFGDVPVRKARTLVAQANR